MAEFFEKNNVEFFHCRYASDPLGMVESLQAKATTYRDVVHCASSNTMFVSGRIILELEGFNESLGVGARYNGGEDLDFAISAFRLSGKSVFLDEKLVGHRDKVKKYRGRYFVGSALVLKKNRFVSWSAGYQYLRKLLIGMVLVSRKELPFADLSCVLFWGNVNDKKP